MENLWLLKSNLTILQKIVHLVEVSPNCPNTANTLKQVYITQPLDFLGTQVRPHSMWNVMLITFCVSLDMIWGIYLGPVSLNCPNSQIPVK